MTITGQCSLVDLSNFGLHKCDLVFVITSRVGWQDNLGLLCIGHFICKNWQMLYFFYFFILAVVTCWLWSFFDSCWFIIKKDRKLTRWERGSKYSLYNFFGITMTEKIEIKILKSQRHHKCKEIMRLLIFARVSMS